LTHAAVPPQVPQGTAVAASLFDQPDVVFDGVQIWQVFVALVAPLPTNVPPIQHPAWQLPVLQTFPLAQLLPSASGDQVVAETAGWQVRQLFCWLGAPVA